jgi:enoyl-CoA hydratase/carnithine racemase
MMTGSETPVLTETEQAVRIITLNRPHRLNALNGELIRGLARALDEAEADEAVRVVVITGSPRADGRQCFSAGGDVHAQAEGGAEALGERPHEIVRDVAGLYAGDFLGKQGGRATFYRITTFPKIVIAAIGGVCVGGGLEVAMACDLRLVADTARIGDPHVKLHSFTSGGGLTNSLSRAIGPAKAKELVLLGTLIDGNEAWRIGLANRVVAADRLMPETMAMAHEISERSPTATRMTKVLANAAPDISQEQGLRFDALAWSMQMTVRGGHYAGAQKFLDQRASAESGSPEEPRNWSLRS